MPHRDERRELADDIRRVVGYMEAIVTKARRLDEGIPRAIDICVDVWRGWFRVLDRRTRDD